MGTIRLRNEKEMKSWLDKFKSGSLKSSKVSVFKPDLNLFFDVIEMYPMLDYSLGFDSDSRIYIITVEKIK